MYNEIEIKNKSIFTCWIFYHKQLGKEGVCWKLHTGRYMGMFNDFLVGGSTRVLCRGDEIVLKNKINTTNLKGKLSEAYKHRDVEKELNRPEILTMPSITPRVSWFKKIFVRIAKIY